MKQQSGIPMVRLGQRIVCSPQIDLDDVLLLDLERQMLGLVAREPTSTVVVDLTGIPVVDAHQARALDRLAEAVALMGAQLHITGLGPGIALSLAMMDVRFHHATLARSPEHVLTPTETPP